MLVIQCALLVGGCSLRSAAIRNDKEFATISDEMSILAMDCERSVHSNKSVLPEMVETLTDTYRESKFDASLPMFEATWARSGPRGIITGTMANTLLIDIASTCLINSLAQSRPGALSKIEEEESLHISSMDRQKQGSNMIPGAFAEPIERYYKHVKDLGRGNFGKVWLAQAVTDKRLAAVKEFHRPGFFNQIEILPGRLGLPNNARLQEVYQHAGKVFLVYEVYSGGTLEDYFSGQSDLLSEEDKKEMLARRPGGEKKDVTADEGVVVSMPTIHAIGRQLALGIWSLHQMGIIHRDVKPANVMLRHVPQLYDEEGDFWPTFQVVLNDYGTVACGCSESNPKAVEGLTGSGGFMTSAQWSWSPQAPRNVTPTHYGPEVDWHAFAILLFQLALGHNEHPFNQWRDEGSWKASALQNRIIGAIRSNSPTELDFDSLNNEEYNKNLKFRDLLKLLLKPIPPRKSQWWSFEDHPVLSHEFWQLGAGKGLITKFKKRPDPDQDGKWIENPKAKEMHGDLEILWTVVCRESLGPDMTAEPPLSGTPPNDLLDDRAFVMSPCYELFRRARPFAGFPFGERKINCHGQDCHQEYIDEEAPKFERSIRDRGQSSVTALAKARVLQKISEKTPQPEIEEEFLAALQYGFDQGLVKSQDVFAKWGYGPKDWMTKEQRVNSARLAYYVKQDDKELVNEKYGVTFQDYYTPSREVYKINRSTGRRG